MRFVGVRAVRLDDGRVIPLRILAVDDDADLLELVCLGLGRVGHAVQAAADGFQAVRELEQRAVDLLVLDVTMPGMSGHEVARHVRSAGGRQPRILIVSALHAPEDVRAAMDSGADDFLAKPFSLMELISRVAALGAGLRSERDDA